MADKELRHMNRTELIEIIYALQQNAQTLQKENEDLTARLEDKMLRMENAGSIAEAALSLNHIFEDAQNAAEQYLMSLQEAANKVPEEEIQSDDELPSEEKLITEQVDGIEGIRKAARNEAEEIIRKAQTEAAEIVKAARIEEDSILKKARAEAAEILQAADAECTKERQAVEKYRDSVLHGLAKILKENPELAQRLRS